MKIVLSNLSIVSFERKKEIREKKIRMLVMEEGK